ncbi:MAG: substrate-binding domain-containing protein [Kiritimatiellae bacterium]|nr:substrate-binding domain-containing protein [Kiritimatiellia bacterium]
MAILLESPYSTHTQILHGILRFTQLHTPWTLDVRMGRAGEPTSFDPARWNFDGLITNRMPPDLASLVRRHRTPVVTVNDIWPRGRPLARIVCDNAPIARMAAAHLLGCGFTDFAFVGERSGNKWSVARERVFSAEIAKRRLDCRVYKAAKDEGPADNRRLREWLSALPRPTALFAAYDIRARQVLDACMEAGLSVPDDIAILSVDNDEILCETATPTLSSISMSTEKAGYEAADLLNRAMTSGLRPSGTSIIRYTCLKLTARRSTARGLKRDELVRRCQELMEASVGRKFNVASLVSRLNVSRRTLETHFRAATGRSLNADITSLRLRRAQNLLAETQMTQTQIAAACGFTDASHMNVVFRRTLGKLPSAFRRAHP